MIPVKIIFWLLTLLVLFTTLAPLTASQAWWVRGWDFPRIHIAVGATATVLLGLLILSKPTLFGMLVLSACVVYQVIRIFPYTPFARTEIPFTRDIPAEAQISLIASNVLMQNKNHDAVKAMITMHSPDVLFLMETDRIWKSALDPVLETYETVVSYPLDNHYGVIFATNLPTISADIVFLSDDETPAVVAKIDTPNGPFAFVGLHPRPPVPGQDTEERDKLIKRAAQLADRAQMPVVAMGDFNDVAWSWTAERFKDYGAFRDPRVGRGLLASFDANSWWMRYPIDQLYLTNGLGLISFSRLGNVGSDHYPMKAVITVTNDTSAD